MKKVLYIGHSFHQKTKSTQFFIDILQKHYEVDFFWAHLRESARDIKNNQIMQKDYDAIVMFQILPLVSELELYKCRNIILIPMYDNDLNMTYAHWSEYYNYKFINFSKSLYKKLSFLGIANNLYLQYAPKSDLLVEDKKSKKRVKIFFWQRSGALNWDLIKKIIDYQQVDAVHMHRIEADEKKDLWFKKPSDEDIENFNITFSSWFDTKDELLKKIQECDVFIAPRLYEGIGQAFIEAMSYGKCVVAPDLPTMNEYIRHGVDGLLFNARNPQKLDLLNYKEIGNNARKKIMEINSIWKKKEHEIVDFINASKKINKINHIREKNITNLQQILSPKNVDFILDDLKSMKDKIDINLLFSRQLNKIKTSLKILEKEYHNIVLYGAGTGAELILGMAKDIISYIVDGDKSKSGSYLQSKKIYPIEKLLEDKSKFILISVFGRTDVITESLIDYGVHRSRIICVDLS